MARCFSFDPVTGEFLGDTEAERHPVRPDEWMLPAHATFEKPPPRLQGRAAVWRDGAWRYIPDHRGETWYRGERPFLIVALGDPAADLTPEPNVSAGTIRAAHLASLQRMEADARAEVIGSAGHARLLQVRAAIAAGKVSAGTKGRVIDKRDAGDIEAQSELARQNAKLLAIELHFARQEAALDALADADLAAWRPTQFKD